MPEVSAVAILPCWLGLPLRAAWQAAVGSRRARTHTPPGARARRDRSWGSARGSLVAWRYACALRCTLAVCSRTLASGPATNPLLRAASPSPSSPRRLTCTLEVVAGHSGVSRVIEAVYIGDLDDPTRWMVQGSVVLTTGPRLEENPESGAELVRLLKRSGMVGVGVAIMPNVHAIPEVMLAAGDAEGLPVLRVPEETPFRRVTSYVFNALASRDMHRLRRSVAMQQHLVDALLDERSVEALVRRLGELLDADAAVLDRNGRLLARWSGHRWSDEEDAFVARAWREYALLVEHGTPRSVFELDDRYVGLPEVRRRGPRRAVAPGGPPLRAADLRTGRRLAVVRPTASRGRAGERSRCGRSAPPDALRSARAPLASARQSGRAGRASCAPRHRPELAMAGSRARGGSADHRSVGRRRAFAAGALRLGPGDCRRTARGARRRRSFPIASKTTFWCSVRRSERRPTQPSARTFYGEICEALHVGTNFPGHGDRRLCGDDGCRACATRSRTGATRVAASAICRAGCGRRHDVRRPGEPVHGS